MKVVCCLLGDASEGINKVKVMFLFYLRGKEETYDPHGIEEEHHCRDRKTQDDMVKTNSSKFFIILVISHPVFTLPTASSLYLMLTHIYLYDRNVFS